MKNWLKSKSVKNIQVFLSCANFYWHIIQDFNKLVRSLTSMFRISSTWSAKNLLLSTDKAEDIEVGSWTSSITRSAKNLLALINMVEDAEVGGIGGGNNGDNKKKD